MDTLLAVAGRGASSIPGTTVLLELPRIGWPFLLPSLLVIPWPSLIVIGKTEAVGLDPLPRSGFYRSLSVAVAWGASGTATRRPSQYYLFWLRMQCATISHNRIHSALGYPA